MKTRSVPEVVRDWFAARPEYAKKRPTSVASLIVGTITLDEAQQSLLRTVVSTIGSTSRGEGLNAVADEDGRTVYVDPIDLPLNLFVNDYVIPQRKRIGADLRRLRDRVREWVEAHPEAGVSESDVWGQAREGEADAA